MTHEQASDADLLSGRQAGRKWLPDFRFGYSTFGPLLALVLLVGLGAALSPTFISVENLENVLARSAFIGIIAIGATFVITSGGIDLSVGSMAAFSAATMIVVMNWMIPVAGPGFLAIATGVSAGFLVTVLAGLFNGTAITAGRIEPFIVTLGMMGILRSLVTWFADGGALTLDFAVREIYRPVYFSGISGIGWPVIAFMLMALSGDFVMRRTLFGRHVAAIGSNEEVARYSAIKVARTKLLTYVVQGACVAIAVFLYVPRLGSATPSTGLGWELEAIAGVIIGGTLLKGGRGRVWGTVVGVIILSLINNLLNLTSIVSPYLNGAVQGAVVVIAVLLQRPARR
ncbi:MAG: ABC transporter permease [Mesorhizobium sp.]|uniref:ABC transporter permease n=1 Tax=Mesorhizobium sp. TaxID=1871066 RepID=UPI0012059FB9|nr:ABC transporter permease [Mesorhizobium sp.]TIN95515.1 MAG: ABC transporter permease [Mesorhizobium sp.]TJU97162.1 MAG: ABC transporter permease [Mesorhizobium sp.]